MVGLMVAFVLNSSGLEFAANTLHISLRIARQVSMLNLLHLQGLHPHFVQAGGIPDMLASGRGPGVQSVHDVQMIDARSRYLSFLYLVLLQISGSRLSRDSGRSRGANIPVMLADWTASQC